MSALIDYSIDAEYLVNTTRARFGQINNDKDLKEEDKKRLKEFYLEHFVAPKARELVQKYFPEEFAAGQRRGTPSRIPLRNSEASHPMTALAAGVLFEGL